MKIAPRLYRGHEINALVYPHGSTKPGFGHNYEDGFNASVRILEPGKDFKAPLSRVYALDGEQPFRSSGDARRACVLFAEQLIDSFHANETIVPV